MSAAALAAQTPVCRVSPLMLADRLLSLAEDADRAGLRRPAARLLRLAYEVCDEKPVEARPGVMGGGVFVSA